jgi:hypothetical protein
MTTPSRDHARPIISHGHPPCPTGYGHRRRPRLAVGGLRVGAGGSDAAAVPGGSAAAAATAASGRDGDFGRTPGLRLARGERACRRGVSPPEYFGPSERHTASRRQQHGVGEAQAPGLRLPASSAGPITTLFPLDCTQPRRPLEFCGPLLRRLRPPGTRRRLLVTSWRRRTPGRPGPRLGPGLRPGRSYAGAAGRARRSRGALLSWARAEPAFRVRLRGCLAWGVTA